MHTQDPDDRRRGSSPLTRHAWLADAAQFDPLISPVRTDR